MVYTQLIIAILISELEHKNFFLVVQLKFTNIIVGDVPWAVHSWRL